MTLGVVKPLARAPAMFQEAELSRPVSAEVAVFPEAGSNETVRWTVARRHWGCGAHFFPLPLCSWTKGLWAAKSPHGEDAELWCSCGPLGAPHGRACAGSVPRRRPRDVGGGAHVAGNVPVQRKQKDRSPRDVWSLLIKRLYFHDFIPGTERRL